MLERVGDLWTFYEKGYWVVITTNGSVRKDGSAVMGRGVALEAKQRFPTLPQRLGAAIRKSGNIVRAFPDLQIITFPVKHVWDEQADYALIFLSARQLAAGVCQMKHRPTRVFMVRPGCGNGGLEWEKVSYLIRGLLDDRFVVVERNDGKKARK